MHIPGVLLTGIVIVMCGVVLAGRVYPRKESRLVKRDAANEDYASGDDAYAGFRSGQYRARALLTPTEKDFFFQLRSAFPDELIFIQIAFSALIEPTTWSWRRQGDFGRISQKRCDFAVCSQDLALLAVVELDDGSHNLEKDTHLDGLLSCTGIRTIRFDCRDRLTVQQIRAAVLRFVNIGGNR